VTALSVQLIAQPAAGSKSAPTAGKASPETDPHLVGWWKLGDASGTSAMDSSKGGHPGKLEGGLSFDVHSVPGRAGKALQFDGKDACVQIPGFKGVTGTQARTVSLWIKPAATGGDLVSWGNNEAGKKWLFGHIRGRVGVSPHGGYLYMKADTADNTWHHVAVVVREATPPNLYDHVKLFKDGVLAEIDDIGLLDLWPIETGDKLDVRIGWRFKGAMADVRVYDRPLSEDEIKAIFDGGSQTAAAKP
jgi:hypothetical protein